MPGQAPPPSVLGAFGVTNEPAPLEGGQGSSWLVGDLVLKPLDVSELQWEVEVWSSILCDGFRIALPQRARDGSLVVDGWCAWERVEGCYEERRWPDIIAVGERFHAALAGVPQPEFIVRRSDPWAIADRVAWGELAPAGFSRVKHLPRLVAALRPLTTPSQLVHGDLTGNVLFAAGLPPAIIDVSPYCDRHRLAQQSSSPMRLSGKGPTRGFSRRSSTSRTSTSSCCGRLSSES